MSVRLLSLVAAMAATLTLAACGKQEAPAGGAAPAAPPSAVVPTPAPASAPTAGAAAGGAQTAQLELGKSVYGKTCAMCHAAGVGGAPKPGDKADWDARMAQGMEVLHKHAIEGFTGQKGMMPAKGGNAAMSDDEVKAAVSYMASK
ncbi:c-type cytochrome [Aquabacterium sp. OR-4]|uniref:c-type cytochrome n=1 Tax=Aquabacterium sp. OR-4 TaxID=2978127 RepID=UPI0028C5D85B|nr:c-type cytochrome [Aquabacterium sp. OR-4]MDT7833670.1 c-type cytochrome [Aquabacterium sp. OR-4]